jgi:hypothetical protein
MRRHVIFPIAILSALAVAGCGDAAPSAVPRPTTSATPTQSAATLLARTQKALVAAKVVQVALVDGPGYKASPALGQGLVDFQTSTPSIRLAITDKAETVTVLSQPKQKLLVNVEGQKTWAAIGPKTAKEKGMANIQEFLMLFSQPISSIGMTSKALGANSFRQVGTEVIAGQQTTRWQADVPPAQAVGPDENLVGLNTMSLSVSLWVDADGFPRRLVQNRKDLAYLGLALNPTEAAANFTRPAAALILATP